MKLITTHSDNTIRLEIVPYKYFREYSLGVIVLATLPGWLTILRSIMGHNFSAVMLRFSGYLAFIDALAIFVFIWIIGRETLSISGSTLHSERLNTRWQKPVSRSFDLHLIEEVCLGYAGRGTPHAVQLTYLGKKYHLALYLSLSDSRKVMETIKKAVDDQKP